MTVTGVPGDLSDGTYRLSIDDVHEHWDTGESVETVICELSPADGPPAQCVPAVLAGEQFPDGVSSNECYRARIESGELSDLHREWEAGVRSAATSCNDDALLLPLRRAAERVPGTLQAPTLGTIDRNKSLLVTGEPGAGKTEAIKLLLHQIQANDDTPMVVFSYKNDYTEWAAGRDDVVRLSTRNASHVYNIFEEIDADGPKGEDEFDEMAEILFKEHRNGSRNIFFPDAASNLLGGLLRYLYREGNRCGLEPDNRELLDFIRRFGQEEAYELLTQTHENGDPMYPDIQGAAGTITPNARKQTAGVYTTLRLILERTFGSGDLGRPASDSETISIRDYMEEPDGRILLLDFPIAEAERIKPAFRFFLHRAISFGLQDRDQAYYVLDEFARIPEVTNMEELVDTGRAQNAQAILGLQSVSQLDAKYGELVGDALRSGMLYELHLRSGDSRTVEYVRHRLGGDTRITDYEHSGPGTTRRTTSHSEGTALLQGLADGEGFFVTPEGQARVALPMYDELAPATRRALNGSGRPRTHPTGVSRNQ
jgi:hypothetical protein